MKTKPPDLLTLAEAAVLLGKAPRTIRHYLSTGLLATVRVGDKVRFRRADVLAIPDHVPRRGRPSKYD